MKQQIFFIHGGDAFSNREDFLKYLKKTTIRNLPDKPTKDIWTKTLAEDLGDEYEVFMPIMPNKQNAKYDEWSIWFERHLPYLKNGVILVGWSLGGMFLAKYLSENTLPIEVNSLCLLAAPFGFCTDPDGNDCGDFQFEPQTIQNLNINPEKVSIWHSQDDFIVPYQDALEYIKYLNKAELMSFDDKNHFLVEKMTELLEFIQNKAQIN